MAFTKIVDSDLTDIGVIGLPDRPGLSTSAMQAKLEETARRVIIPKHNGLINELEATTGAASLGMQTPTGMTGATVQTVVDDIAEKVMQLDPESLSSKADKVTSAVEGNFAGLDSEGNLTDSGNKAADFAAASHTHTKNEIIDFPTLATVATTGAYADLSGQPTLGTASALDVPASGNASSSQVVKGNDSRLSDDRNAADVYSWAKQSTKPSYTASEVGAIASTEKGANGGVAELDSNGKVPSSQLPSYVDDVEEYASLSDFPATGETGKIYIAKDTNKQYRWSGTAYVEISESLALGETSSTAYAGNKGKANADAISAIKDGATIDSFGDVETALGDYIQKSSTAGLVKNDGTIDTTSYVSDISGKADKVSSATSGNFAGLDSNGNLTDSGSKASDFLTQHQDISGKQDKTLSAQVEGQSTVEGALGALSSNKVGWDVAGKSVKKNCIPLTLSKLKEINTAGTWSGNVYTRSGVTYTVYTNKSGYVTKIETYGTATEAATLLLLSDSYKTITDLGLELNKPYILSGCASGGASNTYDLRFDGDVGVSSYPIDRGNGVTFTFESSNDKYRPMIKVSSGSDMGTSQSPKEFYPMVRDARILDPTYAPFIYDNTELLSYADYGVLGVKNLFDSKSLTLNGSSASYEILPKGVRIYNNNGGTFRYVAFNLQLAKTGTLKFASNVTIMSGQGSISFKYSDDGETYTTIGSAVNVSSSGKVEFEIDLGNHPYYTVLFNCVRNTAANGNVTYDNIMMYDAKDTDSTFREFSKTNLQLTKDKADNTVIAHVEDGSTASRLYRMGEHFIREGGYWAVIAKIEQGENIVEDTNCKRGMLSVITAAGSMSIINSALVNTLDNSVIYIPGVCASELTNGEITTAGIITVMRSGSQIKWFGEFGTANLVYAMGYFTNGAYSSHKVIYKDTETVVATTMDPNITLDPDYKNVVKFGKVVNFKVRFVPTNDIPENPSSTPLFTLPFKPVFSYPYFAIRKRAYPYDEVAVGFIDAMYGRVYTKSALQGGIAYDFDGTYICQ